MKKFLLYFGLSILTILCIAAWSLIPTQGPAELRVWIEEKVQKENVLVDLPLYDDGRIDFVTILNRQCASDVTAENNFMVDVYQVSRPIGTKAYRESCEKWMGNPPKYTGRKIESFEDFQKRVDNGQSTEDQLYDQNERLTRRMARPWTKKDLPLAARWLKENKISLDRLVAGSKKPRFYLPLLCEDGSNDQVVEIDLQYIDRLREFAWMLSYRCCKNIGEKNNEAVLEDLLAIRRISFLMNQSTTIVERLVGFGIAGIARDVEMNAIANLDWTGQQIDLYCDFLETMKKPVSLVKCMETGEKFMVLDCLQNLANETMSKDDLDLHADVSIVNWIDIGEKCELMLQWQVDVLSVNDPVVAANGHHYKSKWIESIISENSNVGDPSILGLVPSVQIRTDYVARRIVSWFGAGFSNLRDSCFRHHADVRATYLALKLEKFRLMYNQYPKSLGGLDCTRFRKVILDYYTGKLIKYKHMENLKTGHTGYWFHSHGRDGETYSLPQDGEPNPDPDLDEDDIFWRVVKKKVIVIESSN